jgi:hypothetical protein
VFAENHSFSNSNLLPTSETRAVWDFRITPVPAPPALLLFGSAIAALTGINWRRSRQRPLDSQ